jgi:hypothetical protein
MNTRVGKLVTAEYAIKVGDVKATIKKIKASKGDMKAGLKSTGGTLSLAHFPHTPETPIIARILGAGHPKAQIKVKIKKKDGYKKITTTFMPFIASTGAKSADKVQYNVFKRTGNGREIVAVRTLSVPQMIQSANVGNVVQTEASRKLEERVQHEIEYRLNRIRG